MNSLEDVHRESVKAVMRLMKKEINERKKSAEASEQKGEASSNELCQVLLYVSSLASTRDAKEATDRLHAVWRTSDSCGIGREVEQSEEVLAEVQALCAGHILCPSLVGDSKQKRRDLEHLEAKLKAFGFDEFFEVSVPTSSKSVHTEVVCGHCGLYPESRSKRKKGEAETVECRCPTKTALMTLPDYDELNYLFIFSMLLFWLLRRSQIDFKTNSIRRSEVVGMIPLFRPYRPLEQLKQMLFVSQCYLVTHVVLLASKWGTLLLPDIRSRFTGDDDPTLDISLQPEHDFVEQNMSVVCSMVDNVEVVGEFVACLFIFGRTATNCSAIRQGLDYILKKAKCDWIRMTQPASGFCLRKRIHVAYCVALASSFPVRPQSVAFSKITATPSSSHNDQVQGVGFHHRAKRCIEDRQQTRIESPIQFEGDCDAAMDSGLATPSSTCEEESDSDFQPNLTPDSDRTETDLDSDSDGPPADVKPQLLQKKRVAAAQGLEKSTSHLRSPVSVKQARQACIRIGSRSVASRDYKSMADSTSDFETGSELELRKGLDERGYCFVRNAFDPSETSACRKEIVDELLAQQVVSASDLTVEYPLGKQSPTQKQYRSHGFVVDPNTGVIADWESQPTGNREKWKAIGQSNAFRALIKSPTFRRLLDLLFGEGNWEMLEAATWIRAKSPNVLGATPEHIDYYYFLENTAWISTFLRADCDNPSSLRASSDSVADCRCALCDLIDLEPSYKPSPNGEYHCSSCADQLISFYTIWIALTEVQIDNGTLAVVSGSHTGAKSVFPKKQHFDLPECFKVDGAQWRLEKHLQPGDIVVFNCKTVHASTPNLSDRCRLSIDLRFFQRRVGKTNLPPKLINPLDKFSFPSPEYPLPPPSSSNDQPSIDSAGAATVYINEKRGSNHGNGRQQSSAEGNPLAVLLISEKMRQQVAKLQEDHRRKCNGLDGKPTPTVASSCSQTGKKTPKLPDLTSCKWCCQTRATKAWNAIQKCCGLSDGGALHDFLSFYTYRLQRAETFKTNEQFKNQMISRICQRSVFGSALSVPSVTSTSLRVVDLTRSDSVGSTATTVVLTDASTSSSHISAAITKEPKAFFRLEAGAMTRDNPPAPKFVCYQCMCRMEGISNGTYFSWKNEIRSGTTSRYSTVRLPRPIVLDKSYLLRCVLLRHYAIRYAQDDPLNHGKLSLPDYSVKELTANINTDYPDIGFSVSTVRRALNDGQIKAFISLRAVKGMARCATCDTYRRLLRKKMPFQEFEKVKQLQADHSKQQMTERMSYWANNQLANSNQGEYLAATIDGFDKAKSTLPGYREKIKVLDGNQLLVMHVVGVLMFGCSLSTRVQLFLCLPVMDTNADLSCVILLQAIRNANSALNDGERLPKTLLLQMDNCAKDNKNQFMMRFLGTLVLREIFEEVRVGFLVVGHTHERIDQVFSRLSEASKHHDFPTLEQMVEVYEKAYTSNAGTDIREDSLSQIMNSNSATPAAPAAAAAAAAVKSAAPKSAEPPAPDGRETITGQWLDSEDEVEEEVKEEDEVEEAVEEEVQVEVEEEEKVEEEKKVEEEMKEQEKAERASAHPLIKRVEKELPTAPPQIHIMKETYQLKSWLPRAPKKNVTSGMQKEHQFRISRAVAEFTCADKKTQVKVGDIIIQAKKWSTTLAWEDTSVLITKETGLNWLKHVTEPKIDPPVPLPDAALRKTVADCVQHNLMTSEDEQKWTRMLDEQKAQLASQCSTCVQLRKADCEIVVPSRPEKGGPEPIRVEYNARLNQRNKSRQAIAAHVNGCGKIGRAKEWFLGPLKTWKKDLLSQADQAELDATMESERKVREQQPRVPVSNSIFGKSGNKFAREKPFDRNTEIRENDLVLVGASWALWPCDQFLTAIVLGVPPGPQTEETEFACELLEHQLPNTKTIHQKNALADQAKLDLIQTWEAYEEQQLAEDLATEEGEEATEPAEPPTARCLAPLVLQSDVRSSSSSFSSSSASPPEAPPAFMAMEGRVFRRIKLTGPGKSAKDRQPSVNNFKKSILLAWCPIHLPGTRKSNLSRPDPDKRTTFVDLVGQPRSFLELCLRVNMQGLYYVEQQLETPLMAGFGEVTATHIETIKEQPFYLNALKKKRQRQSSKPSQVHSTSSSAAATAVSNSSSSSTGKDEISDHEEADLEQEREIQPGRRKRRRRQGS